MYLSKILFAAIILVIFSTLLPHSVEGSSQDTAHSEDVEPEHAQQSDVETVKQTKNTAEKAREVFKKILKNVKTHADEIFKDELKQKLQETAQIVATETAVEVKEAALKDVDLKQFEKTIECADLNMKKVYDYCGKVLGRATDSAKSGVKKVARVESKTSNALARGKDYLNKENQEEYEELFEKADKNLKDITGFLEKLVEISSQAASNGLQKVAEGEDIFKEKLKYDAKILLEQVKGIENFTDLKKFVADTDNMILKGSKALHRMIMEQVEEADRLDLKGRKKYKSVTTGIIKSAKENMVKFSTAGMKIGYIKIVEVTAQGLATAFQRRRENRLEKKASQKSQLDEREDEKNYDVRAVTEPPTHQNSMKERDGEDVRAATEPPTHQKSMKERDGEDAVQEEAQALKEEVQEEAQA